MNHLEIELTCISRNLIGGIATVTATIIEPAGRIKRVKDVVIVDIEGGHLMEESALIEKIREEYSHVTV